MAKFMFQLFDVVQLYVAMMRVKCCRGVAHGECDVFDLSKLGLRPCFIFRQANRPNSSKDFSLCLPNFGEEEMHIKNHS